MVATQQDARGSLLIMSRALHAAGCGVPARLSDDGATGGAPRNKGSSAV